MKYFRGFTLIELMLSVALIVIVAGITIPLTFQVQLNEGLDTAAQTIVQAHRRAQILARASHSDSTWGVRIDSGMVTVFQGATYASRDVTYDEESPILSGVQISGVQEVIYDRFSGDPQTTGTTTLSTPDSRSFTITLSSHGSLTY